MRVEPSSDRDLPTTPRGQIASVFVPHHNYVEIEAEVLDAIDAYGGEGHGPCLWITGPTGVGKTTLCEQLKQKFPVVQDGRTIVKPHHPDMVADYVPLQSIEMRPQPTLRSTAMQLLKAYGDPRWNARTDQINLDERVEEFIRDCGTRAIAFDQAQRAVDRNGTVVSFDMMDWFNARHDNTGVCLIFFGLGRLRYLFAQDEQIERRWESELRMLPYSWTVERGGQPEENIDDQNRFMGYLAGLCSKSSIPIAVDVTNDDVAKRFAYASRGVPGPNKDLLMAALRLAKKSGRQVIDLPLLAEAFERAIQRQFHGMINPFDDREWDDRLPLPPGDDTELLRPKPPRKRKGKTRQQSKRDVIHNLTKR